jgi:DNA-binding transcriptional regulator YhcF (GntR family)
MSTTTNNTGRKIDKRQLPLDFDRGSQLRSLQTCVLPELRGRDGRPVARPTAKLLLSIIDHHARGRTAYVSTKRLAAQAQCNVRTVIRATQALEACNLLIVERDGRRNCNRYTIVWTDLQLMSPERSDTFVERSDTFVERSDIGVTLKRIEAQIEEPPPPCPPAPDDGEKAWEAAAADLISFGVEGIHGAMRAARGRGMTAADVLDDLRTAKANASRFRSPPAALASRLRTGDWPASRVRHWSEAPVARPVNADIVIPRIVCEGRQAGKSDDEIRVDLQAAGIAAGSW